MKIEEIWLRFFSQNKSLRSRHGREEWEKKRRIKGKRKREKKEKQKGIYIYIYIMLDVDVDSHILVLLIFKNCFVVIYLIEVTFKHSYF